MTARGTLCHQHLKADKALRITDNPSKPYRLFTTELIPAGGVICQWTGDTVTSPDEEYGNPFAVQIKKDPPTFIDASETNTGEARYARETRKPNSHLRLIKGKLNLIAIRDIEPHEEITCIREVAKKTAVEPKPKGRRVLIRPQQNDVLPPEPEEQILPPERRRVHIEEVDRTEEPVPRAPRAKKPDTAENRQEKQKRADLKFERNMIGRLKVMERLFNSQQVAELLKVKLKPRTITIPQRGDQQIDKWHRQLEQLEKKELVRLQTYFGSKKDSLQTMLDKMQKRHPFKDVEQYY